jgi:hypothetical protein
MDDYKRTLYMIALRDLQELQRTGSSNRVWLCVKLYSVLKKEHQTPDDAVAIRDVDSAVQEFFAEFVALFDGTFWAENGFRTKGDTDPGSAWWQRVWLEPRIRILECLLRD